VITRYRDNVWSAASAALRPAGVLRSALDVGSGEGWFAARLREHGLVRSAVAVEVQRRPRVEIEPLLYDGFRLPFSDQSFDLVYAIDVLHHAETPEACLRELLRCSRRYVLLKDHTYRQPADWLTLCLLDELGNRRFGVRSHYRYQHRWSWLPVLENAGFSRVHLDYPALCHKGLLGRATNHLQFVGLWQRRET
jgi:SAM-dependent methyltransferase